MLQTVHVYGQVRGQEHIGVEINALGSLRAVMLSASSTLTCCVGFADMQRYLAEADKVDKSKVGMPHIKAFFKKCVQADLDSLVSSGVKIFNTVLQTGDLLYTPPGFIMMEQTSTQTAGGIHIMILPPAQTGLRNMEALCDMIGAKGSKLVHSARDALRASVKCSSTSSSPAAPAPVAPQECEGEEKQKSSEAQDNEQPSSDAKEEEGEKSETKRQAAPVLVPGERAKEDSKED